MPDKRLSNLKWPLFYLDGFISYLLNCGLNVFIFFWMSAVQIHRLCWDAKGCRAVCVGLKKNFR